MPRPRRNPFYVVLGIVGFLFTITATSYCVAVLRGVRPAGPATTSALDTIMDRHGTTILVGELVVLALATVGAIAMDQAETTPRNPAGSGRPDDDRQSGAP